MRDCTDEICGCFKNNTGYISQTDLMILYLEIEFMTWQASREKYKVVWVFCISKHWSCLLQIILDFSLSSKIVKERQQFNSPIMLQGTEHKELIQTCCVMLLLKQFHLHTPSKAITLFQSCLCPPDKYKSNIYSQACSAPAPKWTIWPLSC